MADSKVLVKIMLDYGQYSSKLMLIGSRLLFLVNISWIIMLFVFFIYALVFVASGVSIILLLLTTLFTAIISITDILGFIFLGTGLIFHYSENKRYSAPFAGFLLLIWSAVTIIWRAYFVYSLLIYETLTRDDKLEVYDGLQLIFYFNCFILLFGLIFLIKMQESLSLLAYAVINVIASFIIGGAFRMFTDETIVFIGILLLIGSLFKMLVVPAIGLFAYSELIYNVLDPQNASLLSKKKDLREKIWYLIFS
ncbi:MAG: hypothetical protein ACTSRU_15085 [Candidatus Hodarchaeales archaeon]